MTLRNLSLTGRTVSATGIKVLKAAAVHIEDSAVERYTVNGIIVDTQTDLFVSNTVVRDNGEEGLVVNGPHATYLTIKNSHFDNNGIGLATHSPFARSSITDSTASGNVTAGFVVVDGTATFTQTIARGSRGAGGAGFSVGAGAEVTFESSVARDNDVGLRVGGSAGSAPSWARVSNSVFSNNRLGVEVIGGNPVFTLGNNLIASNAKNVVGRLTPLGAK